MNICVDFDGTMVNHVYPLVGEPVPGAVQWCKKFIDEGCNLILWTMRSGRSLDEAIDFFDRHGIVLWGINNNPMQKFWTTSPKAYAECYIDDAAIGCPLVQMPEWDRPCVDWFTVGKIVMEMIEEDNEYIRKLKMYDQRVKK